MADVTQGVLFNAGLLEVAPGANSGAAPVRIENRLLCVPWTYYGYNGLYKVAGTTLRNGVAVAGRRVLLMPLNTLLFLTGCYSNASGAFLFDGLAPGKYLVLGVDPTSADNAVVYDAVSSVAR